MLEPRARFDQNQNNQHPGPAIYEGRWPAWRTAPHYRENPFTHWLEHRCEEYHYSVADLARAIEQASPEKRRRAPMGAYMTIYQWLRRGQLPGTDYLVALSLALNTPTEQIMQMVSLARQQRRVAPPPPPPPVQRRGVAPPTGTPDAIRAAAEQDFLRHVRQMPEFDELLKPFVVARLQAQQQQLAQRVVPGAVPGELAEVPAAEQTEQHEEVTAKDGR